MTAVDQKKDFLKNIDPRKPLEELGDDETVAEYANSLRREYHFATMADTGEIYRYHDAKGLHRPDGRITIETQLESISPEISTHKVNEVSNKIRRNTYVERADFDADPSLVHLNNGWLDLTTRQFLPHSPERLSLKKCAADYRPNADCPAIKKFLNDVLEDGDLDVVKKMLGYILLPHNRYKKAFMLIGPKDTGKSTFLALLEAFVGSASHVSLRDLDKRNHNVVKAAYSMLNTTSEIPLYALKDVSLFKNWTGNDEITVREIYQPPFETKISSKFILATNDPPNFDHADRTFIDRWIVLEFNNVFEAEAMDINILDKMTTADELSGLLNMALEGLEMLNLDGYFKDETYEEAEARWNLMTSKIGDYLTKCTVKNEEARILGDELYDDYCNYCTQKAEAPMHKVYFGRELRKAGYQHKQIREGKRRPWFYTGLTTNKHATEPVIGGLGNNSIYSYQIEDDKIEGKEHDPDLPKPAKTDGQEGST